MTYIEAALRRALIRTSKRVDLADRAAVPVLLRELFEEGVYLKTLKRVEESTPKRKTKVPAWPGPTRRTDPR